MHQKLLRIGLLVAGTLCANLGLAQTTTINFSANQPAQLMAYAGPSPIICPGDSTMIGGNPSATGGTAPFSYQWNPTTDLSSATISEPMAAPTTTTTYVLDIVDARNCTDTSSVLVTVDTCVAITHLPSVGKVSIFPNPNGGRFQIIAELEQHATACTIQVFGINGQQVYLKQLDQPGKSIAHEINLSDQSSGIYQVEVKVDDHSFSNKVIIR